MFDSFSTFNYKKKRAPICYLESESRFQSFLYSNGLEHSNFQKHRSFKNVAAGGIILDSLQRILVVKGSIKWSLPKGHLDSGEKYHHCAMREIFEETGLVVNLSPVDRYIDIKKCLYYFIHYPGIGPDDLQTHDTNEISEVKWLHIDEVKLLLCNRQLEYVIARWDYILNTFQKSKIQVDLTEQGKLHPYLLPKSDKTTPKEKKSKKNCHSAATLENNCETILDSCESILEDQLTLSLVEKVILSSQLTPATVPLLG